MEAFKAVVLLIFGAVILVIKLCYFLRFIWRRVMKKKPSSLIYPLTDMFQKVSYKDLYNATDGFSVGNLVAIGGYGSVYVGFLRLNEQEIITVVAVKVIDLHKRGALKSFMAECEALRCIRHRNVMKVLTTCSRVDFNGNEFKALVFEFMPNGSLDKWLHPTAYHGQLQRSTKRSLKFMERLNVAIEVASAANYLHHHCQTPIVHCDLKPSNVLLDDNINSLVTDFGSAKFLHEEKHAYNTSVGYRGSVGYAALEYGLGKKVTTSGDVYSYGIMLLELFAGRRPTDGIFKDGLTLHSFAKTALLRNQVMQIVDPTLLVLYDDQVSLNGVLSASLCEALTGIVKLGVMCSVESPKERMKMELIVKVLQLIKSKYLLTASIIEIDSAIRRGASVSLVDSTQPKSTRQV
ncbi:probable LRR receptor-like serine/threonine-protein kinase At3g47570 [Papaver somniferum]|nr:probable LRR receptor-like serine/threonine-protein kinase At3g47570 [Papaver somniferum]